MSPIPDRWYCKKSSGNVVAVHITHKLHDPTKTHKVLNSGYVLPKGSLTFKKKIDAIKKCKNLSASRKKT